MRLASLAVALVAIAACATGTSRSAGGRPSSAGAPSPALQAFVVSVELLPSAPSEASAAAVADTLAKLAAALNDISTDRTLLARGERLRVLADELSGGSADPSRVVKAGLREAVDALSDVSAEQGVQEAHDAAAGELASFDEARPFSSQSAIVRATLRHVANGLLASRQLAPAVGARRRAPALPEGSAPRALDAARAFSAAVSRLATSSGSDLGRDLTATLETLADAVGSAADAASGKLGDDADAIRESADRIRGMDGLGIAATPLVRAALQRGVVATESIAARTGSDVPTDWVSRARAAVLAIDDHAFLSFQRAPLQEAFRALADALVYAAERDVA